MIKLSKLPCFNVEPGLFALTDDFCEWPTPPFCGDSFLRSYIKFVPVCWAAFLSLAGVR